MTPSEQMSAFKAWCAENGKDPKYYKNLQEWMKTQGAAK